MSRITILALAILSVFFVDLPALCKPPDTSPQLIIIPSEATLTTGEQLQFRVEINGDIDLSEINVEWQTMGSIGDISTDGLFTASRKPGRGMIRAVVKLGKDHLTAYALVKVAEGEVPSGSKKRIVVIVQPESVVLPTGGTQKFTVEPVGEPVRDVQWRVIPPRTGSINSKGVFIAGGNPGKGIIIAAIQTSDARGTGRARVTVGDDGKTSPGPKLKLDITPKHARVDKGGSAEFRAKVTGLDDDQPLEWEVNPAKLGHIEGTGTEVLFIAGNELEGRALITVKLKTETEIDMDWATIDVGGSGKSPPAKVKVMVFPEEKSIRVGDSTLFTANITGEEVARPSWSVAPKKIGSIDQNGLFNATAPGWGLVIAKVEAEKGIGVGQARVFVGVETSHLLRVTISPQTAEVYTGGSPVKFTAQVTDAQGTVVDLPILWKVVPGNLGSIDGTGTFVPGNKQGHALVTARVEGAKAGSMGQARLTIRTRAHTGRLIVSVIGDESLRVGGSYEYTASVEDSGGASVESRADTTEFTWRVVPSKLGTVTEQGSRATFIPSSKGRGVIIVEVKTPQGSGTGRISITVDE